MCFRGGKSPKFFQKWLIFAFILLTRGVQPLMGGECPLMPAPPRCHHCKLHIPENEVWAHFITGTVSSTCCIQPVYLKILLFPVSLSLTCRINAKFLREHCKKHKLYLTPELNDVLYLHYSGMRTKL